MASKNLVERRGSFDYDRMDDRAAAVLGEQERALMARY